MLATRAGVVSGMVSFPSAIWPSRAPSTFDVVRSSANSLNSKSNISFSDQVRWVADLRLTRCRSSDGHEPTMQHEQIHGFCVARA